MRGAASHPGTNEIIVPSRRNRTRSCAAAARHPIGSIARSLSDAFPRRGSAEDPVQLAFRPLCGEPLCIMLGMQATAEEVQLRVGVRAEHLFALAKEAAHQDAVIGIRFVEPAASKLIARGYQSKNLNVKGKTSNWGPMRGFVPVDQALSKLAIRGRDRIAQASAAVELMLRKEQSVAPDRFGGVQNEYGERMQIVAAPLILSTAAFLSHYPHLPIAAKPDVIAFQDDAMPGVSFRAYRRAGTWTFTYAEGTAPYVPLRVIAYQDRDASSVLRGPPLPVTGDYDLLLLMPSIRAHGSKDNRPVPLVTASNYSAYRGRMSIDRDKTAKRDRALLDLHKPMLGNASARVEELVERLRMAFPTRPPSLQAEEGGAAAAHRPLIHHSDDSGNPFADAAANYPALIVLPKSLARYVRNDARGFVAESGRFLGGYPSERRVNSSHVQAPVRERPAYRVGERRDARPVARRLEREEARREACPIGHEGEHEGEREGEHEGEHEGQASLHAAPYFIVSDHAQFCALYDVLRDVFHFVGAPNPLWRMR